MTTTVAMPPTMSARRRRRGRGAATTVAAGEPAAGPIGEATAVAPFEEEGATMVGAYQSATVGAVCPLGSTGLAASGAAGAAGSSFHTYGTAEGADGGGSWTRGAAGSPARAGARAARARAVSDAPGRASGCLASILSIIAHRGSGTPCGRPGARRACWPRTWEGAPTKGGTPHAVSYRTMPRE